jgi:hypothetical protein
VLDIESDNPTGGTHQPAQESRVVAIARRQIHRHVARLQNPAYPDPGPVRHSCQLTGTTPGAVPEFLVDHPGGRTISYFSGCHLVFLAAAYPQNHRAPLCGAGHYAVNAPHDPGWIHLQGLESLLVFCYTLLALYLDEC